MSPEGIQPIKLFYAYAREDESLHNELAKHLALLQRQGFIESWYDRQILPGMEWESEIEKHLTSARIIVLLISADFFFSDYCYSIEMERALQRHKLGEAWVLPIILRPVDWKKAPFAHIQCLPRDARPITMWSNQDEAFLSVAQGIRSLVDWLRAQPPPMKEQPKEEPLVEDPNTKERWLKEGNILFNAGNYEGALAAMDRTADRRRDIQANITAVDGKIETQDFDVFLCHHSTDKTTVKLIGELLKEKGLLPWLDEWELRPGFPWQSLLEEQIENIKAAAVFMGKNGIGPWQDQEIAAFLRQFIKRQCPVKPLKLPDVNTDDQLPRAIASK